MDYYLQNLDRLEGQPKRTIADYVEQNGILVPRRFDSLTEARKSHKGILLRSEHPKEYHEISGLLNSFPLSSFFFSVRGAKNIEEVKQKYFEHEWASLYKQYCKKLGLDENEFRKQASFSIWENLEGVNRTVIADSSIANRYHIMSYKGEKENFISSYVIVENKKLIKEFVGQLPEDLKKDLNNLIEIYEQVRNLWKFDPNHCPIMEFETIKNKNYFLQYHRTRDFSPSTFTLERDLQKDEIEVPFARGASSKEGEVSKVTVFYGKEENFNLEGEDGSFDLHEDFVFSGLEVRKRKLQIFGRDISRELTNIVTGHDQRSKMFKPKISAVIPFQLLLKNNEVILRESSTKEKNYFPRNPILKKGETIFDFSKESMKGKNSYVNLHIISDGRKAFIKRI